MTIQVGFNLISVILTLVTFVFLLLATISTPVIDIFNLGKTAESTYGIFGTCQGTVCSKATYPVKLSEIEPATTWLLANTTRDNLAKIFIVAPIALGFSFITFILLIASLFTSNTVVLVALVVNVISFITTTLIAVIVVLVFYPNVAWTGWILIGAAGGSLISLICLILQLTLNKETHSDDNSLSEFIDKDSASGFETPFGPMDNNATSFGGPVPNHYNDSSSSFSKGFESKGSAPQSYNQFKLTQSNGVVGPQQPANETRTMSNSSAYYSNPQLANDFTQKQNYNQGSSVSVFDNFDSRSGGSVIKHPQMANPPRNYNPNAVPSDKMAGLPYPANSVDPAYPLNHASVFEHHPEVEGHKPFTELNDFDDDDVVLQTSLQQAGPIDVGNNSDADSDFTSVSQRAINPSYNDGYQSVPQQKYPHVQQFVPHFQQQQSPLIPQNSFQQQQAPMIPQQNNHFQQNSSQQNSFQQNNFQQQPVPQQFNQSSQHSQPPAQHRGPTVSDTVLNNNPDFGVGGIGPSKRKLQNGFVPVANRMNNKPNSASLMGRGGNGGRGGPYGAI
jgi:hypothetical protein